MKNIIAEDLEQLQLENNIILVDYYSQTCQPCKVLLPILEELEQQYPEVFFVKIEAKNNLNHFFGLGLSSVPTVLIYKGKNLINTIIGMSNKDTYMQILNDLIDVE